MTKPINVVIKGEYTDRDVNRAIRDLERLKTQSATTGGALGTFQKGMVAAGGALAAAFSFDAVINAMKDAAQAAMQDEKSMIALSTAMDNVGLSAQNAEAEGLIESMMLQTGIADDRLRPAYQKLVTVTKDVTEAQGLLQTALDLSAAGYGDLESASKALSAAANGNFTALQRLKVPIDQAALASKDFDAAIASLNKTVGGQAAAAADTYAGQMSRITVAVGEAQEAIGYSLLSALDRMIGKMGGTGGVQDVILQAGDAIAEFIDGIAMTGDEVGRLLVDLARLTSFGLVPADKQFNTLEATINVLKQQLALLVGPLVTTMMYLEDLGIITSDAKMETRGLTSATVASAIAAGKASGPISGMANGMDDLADSSANAADQVLKTVLATNALRLSREFEARAEMTAGEGPSLERLRFLNQMRAEMDNVSVSARGAGSAGSKAAEDLAVKWKAAAGEINAELEGLKVSFGGGGTVIAGGMVDAFQSRLDAFRTIVTEQGQIIMGARKALDDYSKSVTDTILGNISFRTSNEKGEPLSAEQIVQMVLGDIEQQNKAVTAISKIATQIPQALAQQIMTLPPDAAIGLANYLANNPAQLEQLNLNYQALMAFTKVTLGDPMALQFAEFGGDNAQKMIDAAKKKIDDEKDAFRNWVASKLKTRIRVEVEYVAVNVVAGASLQPRAEGGPVGPGTAYLVGEQGPEVFVPKQPGVIVPNDAIQSSGSPVGGGTSIQINVTAGVGDPRAIGRSVVEAITLYERSSGPVFARA